MKNLTVLKRGILMLFCLLLSSPAVSQGPARSQLDAFTQGLQTFEANFDQTVVDTQGQVQDSSAGRVWLQRPNLFRWEYGGDFPEVVVADGDRIWIHDVTLEQVTVKDQLAAASGSPLLLLTEPARLDEQFEVRESGRADEGDLLELRSRNAEADFERILLAFSEGQLTLMIMEDAFGLRTEIRFSDIRANRELDETLFEFEPPEGADVIGDLPTTAEQR
jgi:outer membrane lipoprotein carrier protein